MERMLLEYLVNSAWQAPVIAGAAWLGLRTGRPSARAQHAVWLLALFAAVVLPAVSFRQVSVEAVHPAAPAMATRMEVPLSGPTAAMSASEESETAAVSKAEPEDVTASSRAPRAWELSVAATQAVLSLYLAVIAVFLLRLLHSYWKARRMRRRATLEELGTREARFRQFCAELGIRTPEIRRSAETWSPVVIGVRRPAVLFPEGFVDSGDPMELDAVWWHELAHVRRRDYLANLLCRVWMLPIVYHPAAYFLMKRIRRTREMVCDAIAAEKMSSRVEYARCLADLAGRAQLAGGGGMEGTAMFGDGALEERVMELLEPKVKLSASGRVLRGAACAAVLVLAVGTTTAFHVTPALAQAPLAVKPAAQALAQSDAGAHSGTAPALVAGSAAVLAQGSQSATESAAPGSQRTQAQKQLDAELLRVPPQLQKQLRENLGKWSAMSAAEMQEQLAEALKQLNSPERQEQLQKEIQRLSSPESQRQFRDALERLNSPELQKQLADAMKRENSPEFKARLKELNSPEFKKRVEEAAEQAESVDASSRSPEMQKQIADLQSHVQQMQRDLNEKLNSPEWKKHTEELNSHLAEMQSHMQQMQRDLNEKLNSPEWKKRMEELNSPEFRERMEKMQKQLQEEMKALHDQQEKGAGASPGMQKDPQFQRQYERESSGLQARMMKTSLDYSALMDMGRRTGPVELVKLDSLPVTGAGLSLAPKAAAQGNPGKALYESGVSALSKGQYDVARTRWQALIDQYPRSRYAADAKRGIAQSWDSEGTLALVHAEDGYEAAGVQPKKLGDGIKPPVLIHQVDPEYTPQAKAAKFMGVVTVNLWVDEQGNVQHARVIRGVGMGLDEKAIDAVRQYKFKPAMENGKPVMVALNVEVDFRIF